MKSVSLISRESRAISDRSDRMISSSRRSAADSASGRDRDSAAIADFYSAGDWAAKAGLRDGEPDNSQRRHLDRNRMRIAVPWHRRRLDAAHVAVIAAAV